MTESKHKNLKIKICNDTKNEKVKVKKTKEDFIIHLDQFK